MSGDSPATHSAVTNMSTATAVPIPAARLSSFYFAYYAALGAFTPYWSLYLKQHGQDAAAISVLMALWYATRIIAPSTWQAIASRSSRPILWLRIGCALAGFSLLPFLLPLQFDGLFVAMCVFCFLYNAVMPQFEALTLSHLTGRTEQYGRIRVWGSIGFIAVVALFGVIFDYLSVVWLPLLMLPLFAVLVWSSLRNDYGAALRNIDPSEPVDLWRHVKRREVIAFFVVCLLTQISFGPMYTFFSLYLEQHGYRASTLGLFWAIGVAVEIAVFFASARLFTRWSTRVMLLVALGSAIVRWLITALFPTNILMMTLAQLTHALNFAAFFAACMQCLARYFPGRLGGHGQGIFYGFSSGLGGVLGALVAGQAWRIGGGELAFGIAAGFATLACLVAYVWVRDPIQAGQP
ncbi:MAG: MFS transporter [Tahibacter sp.]